MGKKNKKAMELPINVIIVAALALVVLLVLFILFTGRVRIFSEGLQSCAAKQGQCYENQCPPNAALVTNTNCPENDINKDKKLCCVQVFNQ